jgi:hypothetical membrane protein
VKIKYLYKLSGLSGFILPIIFTALLAFSIIQNPWFNWKENAISDLGTTNGSPFIFNTGIIVVGILLLIFSIGFLINYKEKLGPTILLTCSFLLFGVGVYPTPEPLHEAFSGVFFITYTLSFLIIGSTINKRKNLDLFRVLKSIALVVFIIASLSTIIYFIYNWVAISEVVIIYPGLIWCMIYGIKLLSLE